MRARCRCGNLVAMSGPPTMNPARHEFNAFFECRYCDNEIVITVTGAEARRGAAGLYDLIAARLPPDSEREWRTP